MRDGYTKQWLKKIEQFRTLIFIYLFINSIYELRKKKYKFRIPQGNFRVRDVARETENRQISRPNRKTIYTSKT